jgi:hypothetical protein
LLVACSLLPVVEATTVVARLRLLRQKLLRLQQRQMHQHLTQLNYQHQREPKW